MMHPLFSALYLEREPLRLADIPGGIFLWVQIVGGFALAASYVRLPLALADLGRPGRERPPVWLAITLLSAMVLGVLGFVTGWLLSLAAANTISLRPGEVAPASSWAEWAYFAGGLGGLIAVGLPFLLGAMKLRWRRILALAGLSFKEAIRRRVLVVLALLAPVFLFGSWFITSKPEDQLRTYVGVVFSAMTYMLLPAAALISAFSIPADIKQQTIHTIVTKPTERFEIVLGRFLGFYALMTLCLVAVSALSLLYVLRGVHPDAAAESLKARVPLYGELRFENTESERQGINVGREWEYRGYITAPPKGQERAPHTAVWEVREIPAALASRPEALAEYTFDVFRTTKGKEGADVSCHFRFRTWRCRVGIDDEAFIKERKVGDTKLDDELAEKYGYFEHPALPVTDYHTQSFKVPAGLFRNAMKDDPERRKELQRFRQPVPAALQVRVTCNSQTQYVGMAKRDLYFRLDNTDASAALFAMNFCKAAFGLWLQLGLVIGLAVVLSTYLNGVISLLVTAALIIGGWSQDFVQSVGLNTNTGGGPMEAIRTIASRQITSVKTTDSETAGDRLVNTFDDGFRFVVRRVYNVLPDMARYNLTDNLAEGFDIPAEQMLATALLLVGYLLPWMVLSFYLMRWREVAAAT
jgi:hypothetical protein